MPVQINEVIVRAVVIPTGSSGGGTSHCPPATSGPGSQDEIAEQVLEIIKEKKER